MAALDFTPIHVRQVSGIKKDVIECLAQGLREPTPNERMKITTALERCINKDWE